MLRPESPEVTTLLAAGAINITDRCWPLVPRLIEADSYGPANPGPPQPPAGRGPHAATDGGNQRGNHPLDGQWPDTHLEWTFQWTQRLGLTLRRRIPLYDELGRLAPADDADIHLIDRLQTGAIPPASAAHNGILDI